MRTSISYIASVTFEELIKQLPTSDQADWQAAAGAQLKGKPLSGINVQLGGNSFEPYQQKSLEQSAQLRSATSWQVGADLRGHNSAFLTEALALGAEAIILDQSLLEKDSSSLADVRFDYVHSIWQCKLAQLASKVNAIIPQGQLAEMHGSYLAKPQGISQALTTVASLVGHWRLLADFSATQTSLEQRLTQYLEAFIALGKACEVSHLKSAFAKFSLAIAIPASYPETLVLLRATRLLFANAALSFGLQEPLASLSLVGFVAPAATDSSAEAYLISASAKAVVAITAGIDTLIVSPYSNDTLDCRRAITMQQVLSIESSMSLAQDALQGAAWVENTANKLAKQVWDKCLTNHA